MFKALFIILQRKFLNSNNNKEKYESAYNSIIGNNKELEKALRQSPGLDVTYLSDVDSTIEKLENNLPISDIEVHESLEKVGEVVNLE